ncbi:MAG: methyltransferase domain-containing protein [Thauera propionica]|jgi:SAM-dependent methyltransferase|nr:methyltransferase domain-containing protein [Thauera propionica]
MNKTSIFEHVISPAPRYLMRLERIARLLDIHVKNVDNFLEIGPGQGDVSAFALQEYPHARAQMVEFSEPAAQHLQRRFPDRARISIRTHDFLAESSQASFDLILAFEVLEHIEHDLAALRRIHSALLPGGYFLMSVPAYMKKWQKVDEWAGHYRRYEKDELQEKLSSTGFEIRELWSYGFPITALLYPFRNIYYGRKLDSAVPYDKQEASKRSGITRPLQAPDWAPWLAGIMRPLFLMQHVTRYSGLGDGWIALAQKPSL